MIESLTASSCFERVLRNGVKVRRGEVTVVGIERAGGSARVGLVVGRWVGTAVVRNRVKRRLRAALKEIDVPSGCDYVVIGRTAVARISFATLCGWLQEATGRVAGRNGVR